jgi:hypothetical protein
MIRCGRAGDNAWPWSAAGSLPGDRGCMFCLDGALPT